MEAWTFVAGRSGSSSEVEIGVVERGVGRVGLVVGISHEQRNWYLFSGFADRPDA
jgi:hypothetical protein